ncbi:hypothetical protein [Georgenia sp. Z1491]|uniref:hypothetical protein n=1 Tax=Georgenia sp. Z1491 TaxID=3416707 RepID=UPI003CF9B029
MTAPPEERSSDEARSDGTSSGGAGSDDGSSPDPDTFAVPTWAHSPGQPVMEALSIGNVFASPERCPVFAGDSGYDGDGTGLMLPNAIGRVTDDGLVVEYEIEGERRVVALDGSEQSFGGGHGTPENEAEWERVCPHTPVSAIWQGS